MHLFIYLFRNGFLCWVVIYFEPDLFYNDDGEKSGPGLEVSQGTTQQSTDQTIVLFSFWAHRIHWELCYMNFQSVLCLVAYKGKVSVFKGVFYKKSKFVHMLWRLNLWCSFGKCKFKSGSQHFLILIFIFWRYWEGSRRAMWLLKCPKCILLCWSLL